MTRWTFSLGTVGWYILGGIVVGLVGVWLWVGASPSSGGDDSGCQSGSFVGIFCDEDGSVHESNIETLADWEITLGCETNRFCPQNQVTRNQMAAFLFRAVTRQDGSPPSGTAMLPDVGAGVWYRQFAEWAVSSGVIPLVDGRFNPGGVVSRADMAVMLGAAFPDLIPPGDTTGIFADTAGLGDATIRALEGVYQAGVSLGCSAEPVRFCPNQAVTRAQMASFFVRTLSEPSTTLSWSAPITAPEGDPEDPENPDGPEWPSPTVVNAKLSLNKPASKDIKLQIWPRSGSDNCSHPDLPKDIVWAQTTDFGHDYWRANQGEEPTRVTIAAGDRQVDVPVWWSADWDQEPDQTFCITITNLPPTLRWEDRNRTVLPVTLRNDDEPIKISWKGAIRALEGDPDDPDKGTEWPSPTIENGQLNLDRKVSEAMTLRVWPRTGADNCPHPDLPEDTLWAGRFDYGLENWQGKQGEIPRRVMINAGAREVQVPVWWSADWDREPDQAFCITIALPDSLEWKDDTRRVLPVTLRNDDDPIEISWEGTVRAMEGDPAAEVDDVQWPSPTIENGQLNLGKRVSEPITLRVWPRTRPDNCPGVTLLENTVWGGRTDFGHENWQEKQGEIPRRVTINAGARQVDVPVWWTADREPERDEAFCITLPNLSDGLQWKDDAPTVLLVTLRNDD